MEPQELVLRHTGEVIDLTDETQIAKAYRDVDELARLLAEAKRRLREVWADRSRTFGTKTFHIDGIGKIEIKADKRVRWDELRLIELLQAAGAPEELIREVVVKKVSYEVDARRAGQAAKANPAYAEAIEACREEEPILPTVSLST